MRLHLNVLYQDGRQQQAWYQLPCQLGKSSDQDVVLTGWKVARQHARLYEESGAVYLEDFGSLSGTYLNHERISRAGPLRVQDHILIGTALITVIAIEESIEQDSQPVIQSDLPLVHHEPQHTSLSIQNQMHQWLIEALDLRRQSLAHMSDAELRAHAHAHLEKIIEREAVVIPGSKTDLMRTVLDEAIGLGPLERLLEQEDITEIMVNGPTTIFVERQGRCEPTSYSFSSEAALMAVLDRIVSPLGRRLDESSPMVDARLSDGSRVNAVIPPIALHGPMLTIRKFSRYRMDLDDLLQKEGLSVAMADFLASCVKHKKNILVAGGTGSGKTTLLNILSNSIPAQERVITIEDAAELQLQQHNVVSLEARPANAEGQGLITIRDLVRNALRMRPDRIVVGECRGPEAFDMLGAMNTGHEGSLTTLHANSPRDALARLESLILMAGLDLPLNAVREHIAAAIHIIVQQTRLAQGRRLITSISEITGMEAGRIQIQELFAYQPQTQRFTATGIFPACFESQPQALNPDWFYF
ncbi:ATPase, T2SS/T4P/T4SS family [Paenalcaligenes hominis]|uniref:ATPase, T2SS/T4P/T4SS family n=1 Tax=Paenalcaligenes hominis TaxID=643674 RepID=UPI003525D8AA